MDYQLLLDAQQQKQQQQQRQQPWQRRLFSWLAIVVVWAAQGLWGLAGGARGAWASLSVGWVSVCKVASTIGWLVSLGGEVVAYAVLVTQLAFGAVLQCAAIQGQLLYHGSNCDAPLRA